MAPDTVAQSNPWAEFGAKSVYGPKLRQVISFASDPSFWKCSADKMVFSTPAIELQVSVDAPPPSIAPPVAQSPNKVIEPPVSSPSEWHSDMIARMCWTIFFAPAHPSSWHPLVKTRWLNAGQLTKVPAGQTRVVVEVDVVADVIVAVVFVVVEAVVVVVPVTVDVVVTDVSVCVVLVPVSVVVVVDVLVVVVGNGCGHLFPSPKVYAKRRAFRSFESCVHCDLPSAAL